MTRCVANEPLVGDSTETKQDRGAQSRGGFPSMPQRKKREREREREREGGRGRESLRPKSILTGVLGHRCRDQRGIDRLSHTEQSGMTRHTAGKLFPERVVCGSRFVARCLSRSLWGSRNLRSDGPSLQKKQDDVGRHI